MSYNAPGSAFGPLGAPPLEQAPLVVVFERDDALAVPLLSQLRLASYDVRSARTPVELFDTLQKHTVALIVVDLGNATASRREFWVALDAHRRGRATQVLTFRQVAPPGPFDSELEVSPMALADLEIAGPHDLPLLVAEVCRRVPVNRGTPADPAGAGAHDMGQMAGLAPLGPFGPVLGVAVRPGGLGFGNNGAPLGAQPGMPGGFGSSPSPFAHPAAENPFTRDALASPFAQPDSSNPFAAVTRGAAPPSPHAPSTASDPNAPYAPHDGYSRPQAAPTTGGLASTRLEPLGSHNRQPAAAPYGLADQTVPPLIAFPATPPPPPRHNGHGSWRSAPQTERGGAGEDTPSSVRAVADAWVPPDGDDAALAPLSPAASTRAAHFVLPPAEPSRQSGMEWPTQPVTVPADSDFPTYDTQGTPDASDPPPRWIAGEPSGRMSAEMTSDASLSRSPSLERSTMPVQLGAAPSAVPMPAGSGALILPEERALGAVLVEGALLTPRKLEVLKGIKSMLATVEMNFKLGELALLFKFLSPDQLLAALLVSRQLVSPQQIAALGHIKQELGKSGINYDLETLLVMFHIMTHDDLARLRADLA